MREDGIIFAKAFPNAEINVESALEYHGMVAYIADGRPHCTVIDVTGLAYMEKDAREALIKATTERGKTIAAALITNSFTSKMIANFFLTVNKPNFPVRVFDDALMAHQWARSQFEKAVA
jgi:hypothetical protein